MGLPSCAEVLKRVIELADSGQIYIKRNALKDCTALGYQDDHVCEVLSDIQLDECERVVAGLFDNPQPILICVTRGLWDDGPDRLYVKVQLPPEESGELYVLSFKEDGKPG